MHTFQLVQRTEDDVYVLRCPECGRAISLQENPKTMTILERGAESEGHWWTDPDISPLGCKIVDLTEE